MNDPNADAVPPASNSNTKTALAGGAIAALLIANVYLFVQVHDLKTQAAQSREALEAELETLKENTNVAASTSRKHLDTIKEELDAKTRMAAMAASQVKSEALAKIEQSKRQLEEEQQASIGKVNSDLSAVKETATQATAKIADVGNDVTQVKTQVASTKSDLEKTIGELHKVQGDLGVTSGYVATNAKELSALKQLGERNYVEFTLTTKNKGPQHVGDILISLRKADPKRNRYSLEVVADDKKTEKKDRTINEPVQFYVAKARQPYEIVVNEVRKDTVVGYMSVPKVQVSRN